MNNTPTKSAAPVPMHGHDEWMDLESVARVRLTSEDPAHPIEAAFAAATDREGWRAAGPGPQTIWIDFSPQRRVEEVYVCFETDERRTQEFVLSGSVDGGVTYRDLVRQQFDFSRGARREEERCQVGVPAMTDLKLTITPDIRGGAARASLLRLRVR